MHHYTGNVRLNVVLRRRSVWSVVGVLAIGLFGGLSDLSAEEPQRVLLLGDKDYPPITYLEDGVAKGLDVDLAKALAETMGREIHVELMDWKLAQDEVLAGRADGLLSLGITPERKKLYDCVDVIFSREFGFFVVSGTLAIHTVDDLVGKRVGVTAGGFPRTFLKDRPAVDLVVVENYRDGFDRLIAGTLDVMAADLWVGAFTLQKHGIRGITVTGEPFATVPASIGIRKGNSALVDQINVAIKTLRNNGTLAQIHDRWHPQEVVFLSQQKIHRIFIVAIGSVLMVLLVVMGLWVWTLKEQIRSRRRTEQALQESEDRVSAILNSIPQSIFWKDRSSIYLGCNEIFARAAGLGAPAEIVGKTDFDLPWPKQEAEAYRADDQQVMQAGQPRRHIIEPLQQADGVRLWIDTSKIPLVDAKGKVYGVLGVYDDITERLQAEEALRASEQRYRMLFENMTVGFALHEMIYDEHGQPADYRFLEVNPAFEKLTGMSVSELIGKTVRQVMPNTEQYWFDVYGKIAQTGESGAYQNYSCELERYYDIWAFSPAKGQFAVIFSDITQRKQVEVALRESEERYSAVFAGMSDGVVVYRAVNDGTDFIILDFNPAAERIEKINRDAVIGRLVTQVFPGVTEFGLLDVLKRIWSTGQAEHFPAGLYHDNRVVGWRENFVYKLPSGEVVAIYSDVTEQKQAEEKIRTLNAELEQRVKDRTAQLEASNKELEAFSYSVSHDLRAPLRAIDGFSHILQNDYSGKLDVQGQEHLMRVRQGCQRMGQLIDDLLSLSRVARLGVTRRTFSLAAVARDVISDLQATDPERHVDWTVADDMEVNADGNLMRIVMENLLGNTWKFTRRQPMTRVEIGVLQQGGETVYFVRDNGIGFDMEYADRLFGAFQRLHPQDQFEGTGIGLATVQRIIHCHGGRIWAEGAVGQGATFYFTVS